ncbi:hypothetical protein SGLAM104S_03580 [Streptomyces glaucescens]
MTPPETGAGRPPTAVARITASGWVRQAGRSGTSGLRRALGDDRPRLSWTGAGYRLSGADTADLRERRAPVGAARAGWSGRSNWLGRRRSCGGASSPRAARRQRSRCAGEAAGPSQKTVPAARPRAANLRGHPSDRPGSRVEPDQRTCVDNAIAWARNRLGTTSYTSRCLAFVEDAYERSNRLEVFAGDFAAESAELYAARDNTGVPPAGAFVFYDTTGTLFGRRRNWGHVGLSLGDGRVVHAWDRVRIDPYVEIQVSPALRAGTPPPSPAGARFNASSRAAAEGLAHGGGRRRRSRAHAPGPVRQRGRRLIRLRGRATRGPAHGVGEPGPGVPKKGSRSSTIRLN